MKKLLLVPAMMIVARGLLGAAPASARVVYQGDLMATSSDPVIEVKRGSRGWARGNRGRHLGWTRGRGKAFGRKRRFGF